MAALPCLCMCPLPGTPWTQAYGPSQDEAISVREAAVTLLGRHAASNQSLALRLFNTLAKVRPAAGGF